LIRPEMVPVVRARLATSVPKPREGDGAKKRHQPQGRPGTRDPHVEQRSEDSASRGTTSSGTKAIRTRTWESREVPSPHRGGQLELSGASGSASPRCSSRFPQSSPHQVHPRSPGTRKSMYRERVPSRVPPGRARGPFAPPPAAAQRPPARVRGGSRGASGRTGTSWGPGTTTMSAFPDRSRASASSLASRSTVTALSARIPVTMRPAPGASTMTRGGRIGPLAPERHPQRTESGRGQKGPEDRPPAGEAFPDPGGHEMREALLIPGAASP